MNFMHVKCKEIQAILKISQENKISISEVTEGWSESKLSFDMDLPLSDELRDFFIKKHPSLKYIEYEGSPHDKLYRGFKCLKCTETVIFPEL